MRRTGKTTMLKKIIASQKQRVLIYDINNEEGYDAIPRINFVDIPTFKGVKKIFHSDHLLCLDMFAKYLRNSLLVLEDANVYVTPARLQSLWNILVSCRHMGLDVCFTFHSLARVPPWLFEMTNDLILFKTSENPERVLAKIPDFEKVYKNWEEIKAHPDPHHKRIINLI